MAWTLIFPGIYYCFYEEPTPSPSQEGLGYAHVVIIL